VDARVAARMRRDEDEDGTARVVGARRRAGTTAVALRRRADAARRMRRRRIRAPVNARSRNDDDDVGWDEGPIDGDEDDARWGGAPTKPRDDADDDWFRSVTSMETDTFGMASLSQMSDTHSSASSADDIIDGANDWFNDNDDWFEPQYKEVNAPPGTMLEKVQRMTLNEPSDFSFKDGEYFDLMGYVKHKTDNEFCLVLEVAERARERKLERSESLSGTGPRLPPIQQVCTHDSIVEFFLAMTKNALWNTESQIMRTKLRHPFP
jgi:hypothetical protein